MSRRVGRLRRSSAGMRRKRTLRSCSVPPLSGTWSPWRTAVVRCCAARRRASKASRKAQRMRGARPKKSTGWPPLGMLKTPRSGRTGYDWQRRRRRCRASYRNWPLWTTHAPGTSKTRTPFSRRNRSARGWRASLTPWRRSAAKSWPPHRGAATRLRKSWRTRRPPPARSTGCPSRWSTRRRSLRRRARGSRS